MEISLKRKGIYWGDIIRHFILSWVLSVAVEYILLSNELRALGTLSGLKEMSFVRVLYVTAISAVILFFISLKKDIAKFERYGILILYTILAVLSLEASFTWAYLVVCILIFAGLLVYCVYGYNRLESCENTESETQIKNPQKKVFLWITVGISALLFLIASVWTVLRVSTFSTPTYDFGLFAQMFYYMKETGLPLTTLERDGLLSHFNVHVSPIYYLMLPFYLLVPTPATVQVLQAAVIVSAVIPLWKICKNKKFPNWQIMIMSIILLTYPAFFGGMSYDVHENCFLTPLILWIFYGIEKRNMCIISVFSILTLCVKEDAAVYVAVIALWLIVNSILHHKKQENKMLITGIVVFIVSLIWFFAVTSYLSNVGDGVMTYRYKNFMYDDSSSLVSVIKAVMMNPMKAVFECVDIEKVEFITLTLLPLLGLPFITRKYDRYILLIPFILINLMSDYRYQHDIFFQYCFGSIAFLIYLTIVNLADLKIDKIRVVALIVSAVICVSSFGLFILPKAYRYVDKCVSNHEEYDEMREKLSAIPKDATVGSTTFYTTYLSQRKNVYDVKYCSTEHLLSCDYIVFGIAEKGLNHIRNILEFNGYEIVDSMDNDFVIYRKS